jgi:hypothetical protein
VIRGALAFKDIRHKSAFESFVSRSCSASRGDVYRLSLLYLLALDDDIRGSVSLFYDFKGDRIVLGGLRCGLLTGTSAKVVRMGFNLYNGISGEWDPETGSMASGSGMFSPVELFGCVYAPWFYRALAIRLPFLGSLGGDGNRMIEAALRNGGEAGARQAPPARSGGWEEQDACH